MSGITTHVLDTSEGHPGAGIVVRLSIRTPEGWTELAAGRTDADGRVNDLLPAGRQPDAGTYRLRFETAEYFQDRPTFYPQVTVEFVLDDPSAHHHVPLLLSPFGYSTYRGS